MDPGWFVAAVFGWPAIILSLGLVVGGVITRRPVLLLAAVVAVLPFGLYLSANPRFHVTGPAALFSFLLSPLALRREHPSVAIVLASPIFAITAWLLMQVAGGGVAQ